MKYGNKKGIIYASIMISTMLIISAFCNIKAIRPSDGFSAQQKTPGSSLQSSSSAVNSISLTAAEENQSEVISSGAGSEASEESTPVSSESVQAEQPMRGYYKVPLSSDLQDLIFSECDSKKVPADLVIALIDVESDFNPKLVSKTNDYGLMQINICHKDFLEKTLQITNLLDEKQNIKAGVYMLSGIVNKYRNMDQALMVYNCGEFGAKRLWNSGVYSTNYSRDVIEKIDEIKSQF
jgi:soluble lytic murein transglycosylase-like protein